MTKDKRLKHVQRERSRHGRIKWYFRLRRGAPRHRLPDEYGTDEFITAYNECLSGAKSDLPKTAVIVNDKHTIGWAIDQYRLSGAFLSYRKSTRAHRSSQLHRIKVKSGAVKLSKLTTSSIQNGMDDRVNIPFEANNFLKTMKAFCKWLVLKGYLTSNPAVGVAKYKVSTTGFAVWTAEDIIAFENTWPIGTTQRLALDLLQYTGLRRADVVRVGRQHIRNGELCIKASKNNVQIYQDISPELNHSIQNTKTGDLVFLVKSNGEPYSPGGFGNMFKNACEAANVTGRAHGLRKAAATRTAENGATSHQLMATYGWLTLTEATRYTVSVDRRRLGKLGSNKNRTNSPAPEQEASRTQN